LSFQLQEPNCYQVPLLNNLGRNETKFPAWKLLQGKISTCVLRPEVNLAFFGGLYCLHLYFQL
jgi:hypothetical protein